MHIRTSLIRKTHYILLVFHYLSYYVYLHISNIHIHVCILYVYNICILPMFNYTTPVLYTTKITAHDRQLYYSIDIPTIGN